MAQGIQGGAGVGGSPYVGPGGPVTPPGSGGGETPTDTNTVDNDIPVWLWTSYAGTLPNGKVFPGIFITGASPPADTRFGWANTSGATTIFMAYDTILAEWVELGTGSGGGGATPNLDGGTATTVYTAGTVVSGGNA